MSSKPLGAGLDGRIVLVLGTLAGVSYVTNTALSSPDQFGLASDVYATAVGSWLDGGELYRVAPEDRPGFFYLYPPITILLFIPHAILGAGIGSYLLQTAINVLVIVAIILVIFRALDRREIELRILDRAVVIGFVSISPYAMPHLIEGQTTLWLALALAVGFDAIDRDQEGIAGAAFAGAALIKIFPAAVGLWMLRLRAIRGVIAAMLVGIGALVVGIVFGPDLTQQYLTEILIDRHSGQTERVADLQGNTGGIHRQLAAITGTTGRWLTVAAAAILLPLLGLAYRRIDTDVHRLTAILATVSALLLFMPLQPLYNALLFFPVVLLVFTLAKGPARLLLHLGILLTVTMVSFDNYLDWTEWFPSPVEGWLASFGEVFYTFAVPPNIGLWLLLLSAILVHTTWYTDRYPVSRHPEPDHLGD